MTKSVVRAGICVLVLMYSALSLTASIANSKGAQPLPPSAAPSDDAAAQQALRETQDLLLDASKRSKSFESDPKAREMDAKLKNQLGDQSEGAYQISSQIMEKLVAETGGDVSKLKEIVEKLQSNPRLIESYLSAADRQKIRDMAGKLESQRGNTPISPER